MNRQPQPLIGYNWGLVAVSFALALALFSFVAFKESFLGVNTDAAVYLTLAEFLGPYRSISPELAWHLLEQYPFPPLYPVILGFLGGGISAPKLSFLIDAVMLAASCGMLSLWVSKSGGSRLACVTVPVIFALMPATLVIAMGIFSEPLYLLLLLGGFLAVPRNQTDRKAWLISATLLTLAAVTRSVGMLAACAFIVVWLLRTRGRYARLAPLIAISLPLCWSVTKVLNGWQGSYFESFNSQAMLAQIAAQLPTNLTAFSYHGLRGFDLLTQAYSATVLAVAALLAMISWFRRLADFELDALYVAAYVVVIICWPFPNDYSRFLMVLVPLGLFYVFDGLQWCLLRLRLPVSSVAVELATAIAIALVTLPSASSIVLQIAQMNAGPNSDYPRVARWHYQDSQAASMRAVELEERIGKAIKATAAAIPEDACVTATAPGYVYLHLGRRSYHAPLTKPALIEQMKFCPYVLMLAAVPVPPLGYDLHYPYASLKDQLTILLTVPQPNSDRPLARVGLFAPQ